MRFFTATFPIPETTLLLAILATISMIVGNFLALSQKRHFKRLLAYSSIARRLHPGGRGDGYFPWHDGRNPLP